MKYIKKFNEELNPQVYRSAASKFKYYGKEEKHRKLSDWADSKEFGFYNMHFANSSTMILKDAKFTKPTLIGIYTKSPSNRGTQINGDALNLMYADESSIDNEINKLVQNWVDGYDLAIYFEFGFKPTQESILKSQNHSYLAKSQKGNRWMDDVPMFTIGLGLSDWSAGLEEYDSESKWEANRGKFEFIPTAISDFYEFTKQTDYTLFKPYDDHYFGLFSDRQSAQKFKNFFIETMNNDVVKYKIIDILGIINASGKNLEEVFKSFTDIKIHGLYVEDPKNQQNITDRFLKKID
jgi:hypothetical protein